MLFHIIKKQIKLGIRDKSFFIFMLIFPVALIFVLGNLLQTNFNDDSSINKVNVVYENSGSGNLSKAFQTFAKEADSKSIHFKKVNTAIGKDAIKNGKATAFIIVKPNNLEIMTNNPNMIEKAVIDNYIQSFNSQYQLIKTAAEINPQQIPNMLKKIKLPKNAIQSEQQQEKSNISSFQYYAIALIAMTMMFATMSGTNVVRAEKTSHTDLRLRIAPIKKVTIIIGSFWGEVFVQILSLTLLMIISQLCFGINWGRAVLLIFCVYLSLTSLAITLGMTLDIITKGNPAASGMANLIVQIFAFLGGAYFPMSNSLLSMFSPIGWVNTSVRDILYNHHLNAAIMPLMINLSITAILISLIILLQNRKEVY